MACFKVRELGVLRGLLSNGPICYVCCAFFLVGLGFPISLFTFYEYMCSWQWLYMEDIRICRFILCYCSHWTYFCGPLWFHCKTSTMDVYSTNSRWYRGCPKCYTFVAISTWMVLDSSFSSSLSNNIVVHSHFNCKTLEEVFKIILVSVGLFYVWVLIIYFISVLFVQV